MSGMPRHVTSWQLRAWIIVGAAAFAALLWLAAAGMFWLMLGMPA